MAALIWLIAGAAAIAAELATLTFVLLYVGAGAFAASAAAALGADLVLQFVVFTAVTMVLLVATRGPVVRLVMGNREPEPSNVQAIVGRTGVVTIPIVDDGSSGQVRLGSEYWTARSVDDAPLAEGSRVEVVFVEGVTAHVRPRTDPLGGNL